MARRGDRQPATHTEQYEALRLTERLWERFSAHERAMLHAATQGVSIAKNSRRAAVAEKILAKPRSS